jgi:hypothetical protein
MKRFIYFKRISLTVLFAFMLSSPVFADQLTFFEFQQDGVGGVDGLDFAFGVDVSPDGKHVYVTGAGDDAVAVFSLPITSASGGVSSKGGCFIATATYGSQMEPHVKILRKFRDNFLLNNSIGKAFVQRYYTYSPPIADFIAKHANLRAITRLSLLPIVGVSWVALKIGPAYSMVLMLLLFSVLISIVGFRRKAKK